MVHTYESMGFFFEFNALARAYDMIMYVQYSRKSLNNVYVIYTTAKSKRVAIKFRSSNDYFIVSYFNTCTTMWQSLSITLFGVNLWKVLKLDPKHLVKFLFDLAHLWNFVKEYYQFLKYFWTWFYKRVSLQFTQIPQTIWNT